MKADLAREAAMPIGNPDKARVTGELKTPLWAEATLKDAADPWPSFNALCVVVSTKLLAVTVTENGEVAVNPPLATEMDMLYVPAAIV
jgi:hypothetical protein